MIKKLISSLLISTAIITIVPVGAFASWRQNSDSSWSWDDEYGYEFYYGWEQIDGKWYHFDNRRMQTGWINIGEWYYLGADGAMKTGWINDGGKEYYLEPSGVLATDTIVDGYYVDSNGVKQPKENQKVILDNKYVKITCLGANIPNSFGPEVKLNIENKSSQTLIIQSDKISVDGYMLYPIFSATVEPGKIITTGMEFSKKEVKTGFNNIEGKFTINSDDYHDIEDDSFSINF